VADAGVIVDDEADRHAGAAGAGVGGVSIRASGLAFQGFGHHGACGSFLDARLFAKYLI